MPSGRKTSYLRNSPGRQDLLVIVYTVCLLSVLSSVAFADISIDPTIDVEDVSIDQVVVDGVEYDLISVSGYPDGPVLGESGDPQIPSHGLNFLLPTGQQIDEIQVTSIEWDTLPNSYYVYPLQNLSMEDTVFVEPNPDIYLSDEPWPTSAVEVVTQSGMMGVGIVSLRATPLRYIPADSMLLALSEIGLSIDLGPRQFDVAVPVSETAWSYSNRIHGILTSVENPLDYRYEEPTSMRREVADPAQPLTITEVPSPNGDGVDFVIITTESLKDEWQQLADTRIQQGIIAVVRTVEWIEVEYQGCDTQEKIKSFITDAYEYWGTGKFLLGGDHELVPSRICEEVFTCKSYPCDAYYSDVDEIGSWQSPNGYWTQPSLDIFLDADVGRIPADTPEDVETFLTKLDAYENPSTFPYGFGRAALFIGDSHDSDGDGEGASACEALNQDLIAAGIAGANGKYLGPITELYWPESGPAWDGDLLTRNNALDEIDIGANIILHASHSGSHQMGAQAAQGLSTRQYITEGDIQDLANTGMPSVLLTLGCWPGHFQGTECIIEEGLFSSDNAALIGAMAFARSGLWADTEHYIDHFANALYKYEEYSESDPIRLVPYCYLGGAYRHMMNKISRGTERWMNLFGDPSMFIWRGNAIRPNASASPSTVTAGTFTTTVHVTEMGIPLRNARVCLFKEDELFAIGSTDANGDAEFSNIQVASPGTISATVTKRISGTDIASFLPATTSIAVQQCSQPLLCLNEFEIDDDDNGGSQGNGDGEVNPGETLAFDLIVDNNGQMPATGATATLSVISGSEQIETEIDMSENLGTVPVGTSAYQDAFFVQIAEDVGQSSDPVLLEVAFSYDQGSRTDPADFRVMVGETELPVHTMTITEGGPVIIDIDEMYLTNPGLGNLEDVEIEFANPSGGVAFEGDLSEFLGDLENGSGVSAEDGIYAVLRNPSGCWDPIGPDATFDLKISHRWGWMEVSVNAYDVLSQGAVQPPSNTSIGVLSSNQESILYEWGDPPGTATGWYLWKRSAGGVNWMRTNTFPLDGNLRHGGIDNLSAGVNYEIGVSVIGNCGQESSIASTAASTTCSELDGWPVCLDGSTGTGPAITDIDDDGDAEVIAATATGSVFIVEHDGSIAEIYDTSYLFSGVAVGDVLVGGRDEIVVSGWDYDADSGKRGVVVVLRWAQIPGWTGTELLADEGGFQRIHENLSVPVLFNADNSGNLEIALRTFNAIYTGPQNSWLYVWQFDNGQWVQMNGLFPVSLAGAQWDYAPPVYIGDTDNNGYPELVVSKGTESLYWVEPATQQQSEWDVSSSLPDAYQGDQMNWNLGQSFMTAIEDDGLCKIVIVGRHAGPYDEDYYSTACINAEDAGSSIWYTAVNESYDPFGNFGGMAIADIDGNGSSDIVNQWLDDTSTDNGLVEYLALSDGTRTTLPGIPYNQAEEDCAMTPIVIAGEEGDGLSAFGCASTVSQGSAFSGGVPEFIAGSSFWSEDRMTSTPAIGNLDDDPYLEVVFADNSGILHALDMDLDNSSDDWPTLQHDLCRTGYYNYAAKGGLDTELDFRMLGVSVGTSYSIHGSRSMMEVSFQVSGSGNIWNADLETARIEIPRGDRRALHAPSSNADIVLPGTSSEMSVPEGEFIRIAAFGNDDVIAEARTPLRDGTVALGLGIPAHSLDDQLTVVIDPYGEYPERDEENNAISFASGQHSPLARIGIESSSEAVVVNIPSGVLSHEHLEAALFSLDGRLVSSCSENVLAGESCLLELASANGRLPFGCYIVLVKDGRSPILREKVLVLQ